MYRAVFIDIDGTLRNDNRKISRRTIKTIKKITEKGILIVLCSGRPRKYTENISRECYASKYIITSNGGNVYDYQENKTIYTNTMNKKACIELYNIAQRVNARFIMNVGEGRVVTKLKHFDGSELELDTDIETFVNNNDVVQCIIADDDFDKIKNLRPYIDNIKNIEIKNQHKSLVNSNVPKEGSIYYDIANIESCKGKAVERFCDIFNIDLKDTVAIGDDYNDISMFKVVGRSVAMGNANDEVKQYVDEITLSNEEDGVAVFLEKLL